MRYVAVILVLLLIPAALLIIRSGSKSNAVVTLPTGLQVEYLGSATGAETFTTERKWHRMARRALPKALQTIVPPTVTGRCGSGSNEFTFYFRITDPSGSAVTRAPWEGFAAQDDYGFDYEREGGWCSFGGTPNSRVFGLRLRAFPRRQQTFKVNFIGPAEMKLASVRVPNPARGPFPKWQTNPLPQSVTNGPVVLSLERVEIRGGRGDPHVAPQWQLTASDPAWVHARPRSFNVWDPTGNSGRILPSTEAAWKLQPLVFRHRSEDFSPMERLVVSNVTIPQSGEFIPLDHTAQRAGVQLELELVAGSGRLSISNHVHRSIESYAGSVRGGYSTTQSGTNFVESWTDSGHFVLLQASNLLSDDEILFNLTDDRGRKISTRDSGYHGIAGRRRYHRSLTPAPDAKTMSIEVIVSRPLKFEYIFDPNDAKPSP